MVLLFGSFQTPTGIGDWVVLAVTLLLRQHRTQSILGGISLESKRLLKVSECQHRSHHAFHLQQMECFHNFGSHFDWLVLQLGILVRDQMIEWLSYLSVTLDKSLVETSGAQEMMDTHHSLGWHHLSYSFHIVHTRLHSLGRDMMAEVVDLFLEEMTFRWFQFQAMLSEPLKDCCQSLDVLLFSVREDDNIIEVNQGTGQVQLP